MTKKLFFWAMNIVSEWERERGRERGKNAQPLCMNCLKSNYSHLQDVASVLVKWPLYQTRLERIWVSVPHLKFGLERSLHISPKEMVMMSSFHLSRICQGCLGDNWHPWNPSAPWHKLSIVDITVPRLMDTSNPHYITLLGWQRRRLTLPPLPTVQIKTSTGKKWMLL